MSKSDHATKANASPPHCIRLRGVRQNNLRNLDLDVPTRQLVVITGLSGSGKSSLAFETLYAEGQRRYIETFSPYARQFFDRMDKPAVDRIENIPPAIAIEQRNAVRTTRSTVGTMTEICDYMKVLWSHLSVLYCRGCNQPVRTEPPQWIWQECTAEPLPRAIDRMEAKGESSTVLRDAALPYNLQADADVLITFDLALTQRLALSEQLELLQKQGFHRILGKAGVCRIEDFRSHSIESAASEETLTLTVVADRIALSPRNRSRFIEACEQAYHFGRGTLAIRKLDGTLRRRFSAGFHCAQCNISYQKGTPALFSFNNPVGACPDCKGFGRIIAIDTSLALPDWSLSLAGGVVRPWESGVSAECRADMLKAAKRCGIDVHIPFKDLPHEHQAWVIEGEPGYDPGDPAKSWPKMWYGVNGYFRWLESKAYKMHVRVLLSRYRSYRTCTRCGGQRFNSESLLHRLPLSPVREGGGETPPLSLAEFYGLPLSRAHQVIQDLGRHHDPTAHSPLGIVLSELDARLGFLVEVGLGYLTLERPTRTLSGGETERVNLTTCLGSRLVNTLYVLDEPSVGLHPRDTDRLVRILHRLRDMGNTVVVVEHEPSVMQAADWIIDLGPGHGETGGKLVFQGSPSGLSAAQGSLTADYLSGRRSFPPPPRRPVTLSNPAFPVLQLDGVTCHNLHGVSITIPLRRLVSVSGVSGSGKTTLVREVLLPTLQAALKSARSQQDRGFDSEAGDPGESEEAGSVEGQFPSANLAGAEHVDAVVMVDQAAIGRTPRSNPAVYVHAFDAIRKLFAESDMAKELGLPAGAFSFNSATGQCERCRGAGSEKIEMQFLSDIYVRCAACDGRRYRPHVLEIRIPGPEGSAWSIGDVLDAPVERVIEFLRFHGKSRSARAAAAQLQVLADIGLGYLKCGQPINTLSGGESQRLKLAAVLVNGGLTSTANVHPHTRFLFILDEPTTGLHFDDVRILVQLLHLLVDRGHSVLVVEHNTEVIRQSDWVIDLGPDAGEAGGTVVAAGPPEVIAAHPTSHTGRFLRQD